jgi:hypothetical protein
MIALIELDHGPEPRQDLGPQSCHIQPQWVQLERLRPRQRTAVSNHSRRMRANMLRFDLGRQMGQAPLALGAVAVTFCDLVGRVDALAKP